MIRQPALETLPWASLAAEISMPPPVTSPEFYPKVCLIEPFPLGVAIYKSSLPWPLRDRFHVQVLKAR